MSLLTFFCRPGFRGFFFVSRLLKHSRTVQLSPSSGGSEQPFQRGLSVRVIHPMISGCVIEEDLPWFSSIFPVCIQKGPYVIVPLPKFKVARFSYSFDTNTQGLVYFRTSFPNMKSLNCRPRKKAPKSFTPLTTLSCGGGAKQRHKREGRNEKQKRRRQI